MDQPSDPAARIAALERALQRQKASSAELERIVEDRTRELYLARDRIRRQAQLVGARTAIALLAHYGTLERAAPRMLETFGLELGWERVHLWVIDPVTQVPRCFVQWARPDIASPKLTALLDSSDSAPDLALPGRVWASGAPAWIEDVAGEPHVAIHRAAIEDGFHAGCAFPVVVDGGTHAVIEMFSTEARPTDPDLIAMLSALGSQIGHFIERSRAQAAVRAKELQIAKQIQTAILPRQLAVEGLEIAARMIPAADVGGDYFDVLPFAGGAWLGIGDVTGHGVIAGMIMMMVQSAAATITARCESPREAILALNTVLYNNIRRRLGESDHVTCSLLRYTVDGRIRFAGAHEDLLVWRAATGRIEQIQTPGPWLGGAPSIDEVTTEHELRLEPYDLLVLYTDGITEARDRDRQQYGISRMANELDKLAHAPCMQICDTLVEQALRWAPVQEDDISVLVMRYRPQGGM